MEFNIKEYLKLLDENKDKEAFKYRTNNMPSMIYKYVSLNDDKDLNNKKFTALGNNKIWLSTYNNLNDPYELKSLYLNKKVLEEYKWPIDMLEDVMEQIRKSFLIGSFTRSVTDNMPMWAHYANNHRGFCIKYKINNAQYLYKVSYESNRVAIASIITHFIHSIDKVENNTPIGNTDYKYCKIIQHVPTIKHKSWKYEDEYRIIFPNFKRDAIGRLCKNDKLGILIDSIYVGSNCCDYNIQKLKYIGKTLNCKVYKMFLDEYESKYSLKYRMI